MHNPPRNLRARMSQQNLTKGHRRFNRVCLGNSQVYTFVANHPELSHQCPSNAFRPRPHPPVSHHIPK